MDSNEEPTANGAEGRGESQEGEEKIVRAVRTTRELWNAYGEAVAVLGTDRAKHLNAYMKRTVQRHTAKDRLPPPAV